MNVVVGGVWSHLGSCLYVFRNYWQPYSVPCASICLWLFCSAACCAIIVLCELAIVKQTGWLVALFWFSSFHDSLACARSYE